MTEPRTASLRPTPVQHTVASQLGGAASTILLYPVDVIRMRYMSQDGTTTRQHNGQNYRSIVKAFRTVYYEEGGVRAFFRGCHVSLLGSISAWGVYMYIYRWQWSWYTQESERGCLSSSNGLTDTRGGSTRTTSTIDSVETWRNLLERSGFSIIASCASAVACNPLWLLKTRMQLEEASASTATSPRNFRTFRGGLIYTVRNTGIRSLWRGVSAQTLLAVPNALNLPLYDTVKASVKQISGNDELAIWEVGACTTVTKLAMTLVCHPILVVKTRLQDHRARLGSIHYESFLQATKTIWRLGGVQGFYRGTVASLGHSLPRSFLMFLFYEQFLRLVRMTL